MGVLPGVFGCGPTLDGFALVGGGAGTGCVAGRIWAFAVAMNNKGIPVRKSRLRSMLQSSSGLKQAILEKKGAILVPRTRASTYVGFLSFKSGADFVNSH